MSTDAEYFLLLGVWSLHVRQKLMFSIYILLLDTILFLMARWRDLNSWEKENKNYTSQKVCNKLNFNCKVCISSISFSFTGQLIKLCCHNSVQYFWEFRFPLKNPVSFLLYYFYFLISFGSDPFFYPFFFQEVSTQTSWLS